MVFYPARNVIAGIAVLDFSAAADRKTSSINNVPSVVPQIYAIQGLFPIILVVFLDMA
jgi:C4-dicarboxylate transporter